MSRAAKALAFGAAVAAGCSSGSEALSDPQVYLRAIAEQGLDVQERFALCRSLRKDVRAGECMLAVAQRSAETQHRALGDYCPEIPKGVWRDECFFIAAEVVRRKDRSLAAELCARSGQFVDDCGQHLWQTAIGQIAPRSTSKWNAALPRAQRLYDEWAPVLDKDTDFSSRFWQRFYQRTLEPIRVLDLSACDALAPPHDARCTEAAAELYWRRVHMLVSFPDGKEQFCAASMSDESFTRVAALPRLEAKPHPALEAVITTFKASECAKEP